LYVKLYSLSGGVTLSYTVTEMGPFGIYQGTANGVDYAYYGGRGSPPLPCAGGGAVSGLLTLPSDPNTIWLASVNGGVWKTTNGGANWVSLTDFKVPSLSVNHLSFDLTDPTYNTIIASVAGASNLAKAAGNMVGMYYTTNGGNSWTVPDASSFQTNGIQVRASFKIVTRIVACINAFWSGAIQ